MSGAELREEPGRLTLSLGMGRADPALRVVEPRREEEPA